MNPVPAIAALVALWMLAPEAAAQASGRIDLGLGAGAGGVTPALAVRGAAGMQIGRWGGSLRGAGHVGQSTCDPCPFGIPNPEVVRELAFLATRGLGRRFPQPLLVGLGVGRVSGERDDPEDFDRLIPIPSTWGAAFEVIWELGDGRGFGGGIALQGNLNGEASFVALVLSGSLGFRADAG